MHQMTQRCTQIDWSASDVSAARWRFASVPRRKNGANCLIPAKMERGKKGEMASDSVNMASSFWEKPRNDNSFVATYCNPGPDIDLTLHLVFIPCTGLRKSRRREVGGLARCAFFAWKDLSIQPLSYHFSHHSPCIFFPEKLTNNLERPKIGTLKRHGFVRNMLERNFPEKNCLKLMKSPGWK